MVRTKWTRFTNLWRTPTPESGKAKPRSFGKHVAERPLPGSAQDVGDPRSGVWEDAGPTKVSSWVIANGAPGRRFSVDWCRFRRNSHCYFSDIVDEQASEQAGHAVLVPMDRGYCWRSAWETQQKCGAAQPGPRATGSLFQPSRLVFTDATVPWEASGQRDDGSQVTYTPPAHTVYRDILGSRAPESLGDDERVTETPDEPILFGSNAPDRKLDNSQRARAIGDLVQLRTGGFLSFSEYRELRSRVEPGRRIVTEAAPLGDHDAMTRADTRLDMLRRVGILTDGEHHGLSARL